MKNFEFSIPTDVLFGRNQEAHLPLKLAAFGHRVLLCYGGGSIKRTGLYARILELLTDFEIFELAGIEPNPRVETLRKGVDLCKRHAVDVVLAVGGGSSIDCAKAVAAGAKYAGDPWDIFLDMGKITAALPIVAIPTIAAAGSELDPFAVISNPVTQEKLFVVHPCLMPSVSILNPENTFSVSTYHTAAGASDTLSHLLENFFDREPAAVADGINLSLMQAVVANLPPALKCPTDYEARSQLMWASALALSGLGSAGKDFCWSVHYIEHELSAYYDITHGTGLAILTPHWMRHVLNENTVDKFCSYGKAVWNIGEMTDRFATANSTIEATAEFFKKIGMPTTLHEVGIDNRYFHQMATKAVRIGKLHRAYVPLDEDDVLKILTSAL